MAFAGTLTVSAEELYAKSSAVESERSKLQALFDDLRSLIEGSAGYWVGDAGEAHRRMYLARIGKVSEMLSRYQEHVRDLQMMAGVYDRAEAQAQSQGQSLPASTL